jgi:hypothetical protein
VHHWVDLVKATRRAPSWRDALRLWRKGPAYQPAWSKEKVPGTFGTDTPIPETSAQEGAWHLSATRYDSRPSGLLTVYAVATYLLILAATLYLLFEQEALARPARLLLSLFIVWSVANVGAIFDRARWAFGSEVGRLAAIAGAALFFSIARGW